MANIQVVVLPADPQDTGLVNSIVTNSNTYCSGKIGKDYAKQLVNVNEFPIPADANERVMYIGFEGETASETARAFVIVTKYTYYWYIDLICSAPTAGVITRKMSLLRSLRKKINGRTLLSQIADDARTAGMNYIKLSALEGVITYYYSQGYQFIEQCDGKREPDWIKPKMQELEAAQNAVLDSNYSDEKKEGQLEQLEKAVNRILTSRDFKKQVPGVYTEQDLRTSVGAEPENPADNGYTMILCLPRTGGSRRTRKKRTKRTRKSRKQKRTKRRKNTKRRRGRKSTIRRK